MTALAKYDAACKALAAAKSVDEVKDIRDKATAMKAYARQAQNKQLEIDASEIRIRAERRLGEMMAEQREAGLLNKGGGDQKSDQRGKKSPSDLPTLADAGIDKDLAKRARQYASIPAKKFESILAERRERIEQENERVSVKLHTEAKKHKSKSEIVEDDEEDISETFTSDDPNDAYLAFLMRVEHATKFAKDVEFLFQRTSSRKRKEVLEAAKSAASAWSSAISNMEKAQ